MSSVGIDFGTTNSVVAIADAAAVTEALRIDTPSAEWAEMGFDKVLPTVIALDQGDRPIFGWLAKQNPNRLEAVKRLFRQETQADIGGHPFAVEELATMLFAHMRRQAAEAGIDADRAVVTVPANSRGLARYRTKIAAGMAGLDVLALINEPTAAAMAYGARLTTDQRIMVVDWGGGTLDVTILQADAGVFIEQASKGVQQLGGLDFDGRLAQLITADLSNADSWSSSERAQFRLDVERAKIRLSTAEFTNLALPRGAYYRVTRDSFEESVVGLVERVRQPIAQTLRDVKAGAGDIDVLLLVGGTCNIPAVRNLVRDVVGLEPVSDLNPMTAIAEGAAIAAGILTGEIEENDFFVGTEHALGTYALVRDERRFSTIIPRNHKLPAKAREAFFPVTDEQETVKIEVVEGDPDSGVDHEDNVVLKEWSIPLPEGRSGIDDKGFDVIYEYDVDGILHVLVEDHLTGATLLEEDVSFGITRDKRELVKMSQRARASVQGAPVTLSKPSSDPRVVEVLQRARTKVVPFLEDQDAEPFKALVAQVEDAGPHPSPRLLDELEAALRPYSYLF